jgi:glucans biosynthesis protein
MSNNAMHDHTKSKCLAKTRHGTLCQTSPVKGKKRCRMHGGAKGIGAPKGSTNALKHGFYSKESIQRRVEVRQLIREFKNLNKEMLL